MARLPFLSGNFFDLTNELTNDINVVDISVVAPNGGKIKFSLDNRVPMTDMFNYYCRRECIAVNAIELRYKKKLLHPNDTPMSLNMKHGSKITAILAARK